MTTAEATAIYNAFTAQWKITPYWTSFTDSEVDAFFAAERALINANLLHTVTYNED